MKILDIEINFFFIVSLFLDLDLCKNQKIFNDNVQLDL